MTALMSYFRQVVSYPLYRQIIFPVPCHYLYHHRFVDDDVEKALGVVPEHFTAEQKASLGRFLPLCPRAVNTDGLVGILWTQGDVPLFAVMNRFPSIPIRRFRVAVVPFEKLRP
ncbi:hypothetical protein EBZ80_01180 [bacterium]|nr:hypothetical protein [bacterium]